MTEVHDACNVPDATAGFGADAGSTVASVRPQPPRPRMYRGDPAAVGGIVAGIAHEINTPVQFAADSVHFLRSGFESLLEMLEAYRRFADVAIAAGVGGARFDEVRAAEQDTDLAYLMDEMPDAFDRASAGLDRIADMTRAMQAVAGHHTGTRAPADLDAIVRSVLTVARNEYKYTAELEVDCAPSLTVFCVPAALAQAILAVLNELMAGAADAGETGARWTLRIGARADGDRAILSIGLAGRAAPGSGDAEVDHGSHGAGPAPGLAAARAIVADHGGMLSATETVDGMSTFHIRLPLQSCSVRGGWGGQDPVRG